MAVLQPSISVPADTAVQAAVGEAARAVSRVVRGHDETVQLALMAILARGHVLLEDVPGVGKTTLARALARVIGASFMRLQFTSDMLPADVLGVHILDPKDGALRFKKGPIFADVVLADEINRASPKTQSALLEAMAERKVSLDDTTHALPEAFTVLATQNPLEHHGAYPLPESQLDRFMVRLSLGYPSRDDERALVFAPEAPEQALATLAPALPLELLAQAQRLAASVRLSEPVADYLLAIVGATREHTDVILGASPRASIALASMARARAFFLGRAFVLPDDVQALAVPVLAHRLVVAAGEAPDAQRATRRSVVDDILTRVAVPR